MVENLTGYLCADTVQPLHGGLTGEGGNPAYPNRFQSPLIPLFGLYPSSSTFPKRERKRKVYLLGKRAYYHVYCKPFVTLQSPKSPLWGDLEGLSQPLRAV